MKQPPCRTLTKKQAKKFLAPTADAYFWPVTMGSKFIKIRGDKGWSEHKTRTHLKIEKADFLLLKKYSKYFRWELQEAKEAALLWWRDAFGRAALYKSGDINGILSYIKMEFGKDLLDVRIGNESFDVTYTVRPKVD